MMFALANGFHYSSLFLICAALLMLPLPFMSAILSRLNIKTSIAVILSIILLFVGALTSPVEPEDADSNGAEQTTTERRPSGTTSGNNTTKPNTTTPVTTTKPETTTPEETTKPETTTPEKTTEPQTTAPETTKKPTTTPNTTTKPSTTTKDDEVEMVWVSSSGKKYHSKSTCSNMSSPRQISLESAIKQGYTACKKCH